MTSAVNATVLAVEARKLRTERADILAWIALAPALLLFVTVTLIPLGWAFNASLHEIDPFSPDWEFVGLLQYANVLSQVEFWQATLRSTIFGVGSTALQLVLGVAIAVALNRPFPGVALVRAMIFVGYLLPPIVIALTFRWMGLAQYGVFNDLLMRSGLIAQPIAFFGDARFAMTALIFVATWQYTGFVALMVVARLQSIPERLYEAARIDGAGPIRQFLDVTLPQIKGIILVVLLLRFVWMFNKFDLVFTTTRGGPGESTRTLPIFIFETAFTNFQLGAAAAVAALLFIQLVVVAAIFFALSEPEEEASQ